MLADTIYQLKNSIILRPSPNLALFLSGIVSPSFAPDCLIPVSPVVLFNCTITYSHSHVSVYSTRSCRLDRAGTLIHLCSFTTPELRFSLINNFLGIHSGIPVIPKYTTELSNSVAPNLSTFLS